jgi:hypothetical protein
VGEGRVQRRKLRTVLHGCGFRGGGRGLPFVQKGKDVFGGHGAGGFEFAALLTEEEFAIGIEHGDGGNATFERDIVFFGDVEIFVHLADVDVGDDEGFVERRSDLRGVEGFVEDVAIEAPVATKDEEDALARGGGDAQSFGDFLVGVDTLGIDFLIFERLAETGSGGVADNPKTPLIVLTEPVLRGSHELFLGRSSLFKGEGELEDQRVDVGAGLLVLDNLGSEIGKTFGFPGGPEGDFVLQGDGLFAGAGDVRCGRLGVERGERGGISSEDGGTPFFEGREGGRGGLARRGDVGKCQSDEENRDVAHGFHG